jgi:hypothetical protein
VSLGILISDVPRGWKSEENITLIERRDGNGETPMERPSGKKVSNGKSMERSDHIMKTLGLARGLSRATLSELRG